MPQDRALRHQCYQIAYERWFAALPKDEQRRLREIGLGKPEAEQFGPVNWAERDEDFEWEVVAAAPAGSTEETALSVAFSEALAWCCGAKDVVGMGQRLLIVMYAWRPALVAGLALEIERELIEQFRRDVSGGDDGNALGSVLEWARRGATLAQIGQRLLAMVYVVCPGAIEGLTLADIGRKFNKTRQAIDKLVQDFRDTFGGMKSRSMRSEQNRLICRKAQLKRA